VKAIIIIYLLIGAFAGSLKGEPITNETIFWLFAGHACLAAFYAAGFWQLRRKATFMGFDRTLWLVIPLVAYLVGLIGALLV